MAGKSINRSIRIYINGNEVKNTLNSVKGEVYRLTREVGKLERGTDEYVKKSAELRTVKKYWNEMKQEINGLPSLFDRLTKSAGGFIALFGIGFGIQNFIQQFQRLLEMAAELSDLQANVQKTTGMTRKEVRGLTKDLDALNTRTSRADLLAIAEEGGRIGIPKEEIAAFTKEMDKANVALGDTFGSASEVANVLGKLRFLYKETAEMGVSEAYNSIGSALNELGANGVASEQNIAAFATRVGALPNAFKPSIAEAMALGAAFEESGVDAEVASRSYGILVQTAAKNTKAFAQVMNTSQAEVEELINKSPVEFFLRFSKSLKGLDSEGVKMAKVLDALGVGADGVNKVIGAAANNNDRFRESIQLSNIAMEERASLDKEFQTKNENLAAVVEKIQKNFVEWVTDERIIDFIETLVNWFAKLIGAVDDADGEVTGWRNTLVFLAKVIGIVTASLLSYNAGAKLVAMWTNRMTIATNLFNLSQKSAILSSTLMQTLLYGLSAAAYLMTGRVKLAAQSWLFFNAAVRANPLGLALTVLTAIVAAMTLFKKESKEAAAAQENFSSSLKRINSEVSQSVSKTEVAISSLVNTIKDEKVSLDTRKRAYEELIKIAPEFNGYLKDEEFNIKGLLGVYDLYIKRLHAVAQAKAIQLLYEEKIAERTEAALNRYKAEKEAADIRAKNSEKQYKVLQDPNAERFANFAEAVSNAGLSQADKSVNEVSDFISNEIKKTEESINYYDSQMKALISEYGKSKAESMQEFKELAISKSSAQMVLDAYLGGSGNDQFLGTIPSTEKKEKKGKSDWEKELDRRKKIAEEILRQQIENAKELLNAKRKAQDEELELMEDGFLKELKRLDYEQNRRKEDLEIEIQERIRLQEKLFKDADFEYGKGNTEAGNALFKLAQEQIGIIAEKEATITAIEQKHLIKRQQLKFEYSKKDFEEKEKAYQREIMNLETRHNNELKAVKDLENAKKLLREQYGYSNEELTKLKDFEKAKSEIVLAQQKETFELQSAQLQEQIKKLEGALALDDKMSETLLGKLFSAEQREQILIFIDELKNKLSELNEPDEKKTTEGDKEARSQLLSGIDLLGFTGEDWVTAFDALDQAETKLQKLAAVSELVRMGFQTMTNALGQFYDAQNRRIQNDLQVYEAAVNRKKTALAKQLEQGIISQETYNAKVAKLEADLEKKRAEAEYKQAMNEWRMQMIKAVGSMALGILNSLAYGGPVGIAFAAITAALGAFQIASLASAKPKKPTGYFSGGPTRGSGQYDQYGRELADGPFHANEYVIPEYLRKDPIVADAEKLIEARRRGMSPNLSRPDGDGSADGVKPKASRASENQTQDNAVNMALLNAVNRLNDNLEYMMTHPLQAEIADSISNGRKMNRMIENFTNWFNRGKR